MLYYFYCRHTLRLCVSCKGHEGSRSSGPTFRLLGKALRLRRKRHLGGEGWVIISAPDASAPVSGSGVAFSIPHPDTTVLFSRPHRRRADLPRRGRVLTYLGVRLFETDLRTDAVVKRAKGSPLRCPKHTRGALNLEWCPTV
jgi:hypothetical protein